MAAAYRIALTADLHWGSHAAGDSATLALVEHLRAEPPDVLILAGDVGADECFEPCLGLFGDLPTAHKLVVPGNHDIWVRADDARGDSWQVYTQHLPQLCQRQHFHYLDAGPLILPEHDLAIVGTINWYDYSWSLAELAQAGRDDWQERLARKWFTRGFHNDARFVRWPLTDADATERIVATFGVHLQQALDAARWLIVVTHHPPIRAVSFPIPDPPSFDDLLWEAFAGNTAMQTLLSEQADRIHHIFCGHTHRARSASWQGIDCHNIGGDYHRKRLLTLDWPGGVVSASEFEPLVAARPRRERHQG
jgi:3',5'-cyclic AMP phosphodiesterase CpdA